jgi:hypothetical protein
LLRYAQKKSNVNIPIYNICIAKISDSGHEQNELEIEATKNLQNIIKEEGQVSEQKDSVGKAKKHIEGPKHEKDEQKVSTIQKAKNVNDNTQENNECQDNDDEFEEESIEDEQPGYDELDYDDDESVLNLLIFVGFYFKKADR